MSATAELPAAAGTNAETETWTRRDVAQYLHVSENTISLWVRDKLIPEPARIGHRMLWEPAGIRPLVVPRPEG